MIDEATFSAFCTASSAHRNLCGRIDLIEYGLDVTLDRAVNELAHCEILREKIGCDEPIDYIQEAHDISIFQESGDDYIYGGRNPLIAVMETVTAQRLFGAVLSVEDTFISSELGMFTGKTVLVPKDSTETVERVQKEKGLKRTGPIIDIGPQRVMLPVVSQKNDVSTSLEGKMNLLARVSAYSKNTLDEWYQEKASIMQDVLLGVGTYGKKFPYLPCSLGGYDKSFPFKCRENVTRSIRWWKRGTYSGLIQTIISHACKVITTTSDKPFQSNFLDHVKKLYSGWQPWYANYRRQLPTFSGKLKPEFVQFRVGSYGESFSKDMAIRRLTKEGLLVPENQLIIASEVQGYVEALMDPRGLGSFRETRLEIEKKFRSETAFSKSFSVLYNDYVQATVVNSLTDKEIEFALSINLENTIQVKNFLLKEEYFSADALDYIYLRGPQKVNLPLRYKSFITTFARKRLSLSDQLLGYQDEELETLYQWLLLGGNGAPPRDLLEDDDVIYQSIIDSLPEQYDAGEIPSVILVSDDIKLAKKINREIGVVVWRVPSILYLKFADDAVKKPKTLLLRTAEDGFGFFREKVLSVNPNVRFYGTELDTGSLAAASVKMFREHAPIVEEDRRRQNFTVRTPIDERVRVTGTMLDSWPLDRSKYVYDNEELIAAFRGRGNASNWRERRTAEEIMEEMQARKNERSFTVLAPPKPVRLVDRVKNHAFVALARLRQRSGVLPPGSQQAIEATLAETFEFKNSLMSADDEEEVVSPRVKSPGKEDLLPRTRKENKLLKLFKDFKRPFSKN